MAVVYEPDLRMKLVQFSLWAWLTWMLYRRPRSWGLGVGIFMLIVTAIQFKLWWIAVTQPDWRERGLDDSWAKFGISVLPLMTGGICSISLRWLFRPGASKPQPAP